VPLRLNVELGADEPTTPLEAGRRGADAIRRGLLGWHCYWDGVRFLLDASRCKKARPQASYLALAWCRATAGRKYADGPTNRDEFIGDLVGILREGMKVWPEDIDEPRKRQLERARSRKKTLDVSQKAVRDFEEFRAVFDIEGRDVAEGLDLSLIHISEPTRPY